MNATRLQIRAAIRNTLEDRARRYEGQYIRPPEERQATKRQTGWLLLSIGLFGCLVVGITLMVMPR